MEANIMKERKSIYFKRLKKDCPECGRKLLKTKMVNEWCEDCSYESGRKKFIPCKVFFPQLRNNESGRSKIKDADCTDELLLYPIELDEFKHESNYCDIEKIIKKDLFKKLSVKAQSIIILILGMNNKSLLCQNERNVKIIKNLGLKTMRKCFSSSVKYKKVLREIKKFVKKSYK